MLSYQHIYHAGGLADVHKHAVISAVLNKLCSKNQPITFIDTHAGRGIYNIQSQEAKKTQEAKHGILSIKIPSNHPYKFAIKQTYYSYGKNYYPGSGYIAKLFMKDCGNIYLCELHPKEFLELKKNLIANNVHVFKCNGYSKSLNISLPRKCKTLLLIDPSYEVKTEYDFVANFVLEFNKKWPEAIILLWYPILSSANHLQITNQISSKKFNKIIKHEVMFNKLSKQRVLGSGVICINPPSSCQVDILSISNWFNLSS